MLKNFIILTAILALTNANILREPRKKFTNYKRAVDPYSYPVPSINFEEKPGKSKVIVETIKSISPQEFIPSNGDTPGPIEANVPGTTIPGGSVTYSAFEPDPTQKLTTANLSPTVTTTSYKNVPSGNYGNFGYQSGSSSSETLSSTASPAPVRTSSGEPATALFPGLQYNSRGMTSSATSAISGTGTTHKTIGSKIKPNGYGGYSPKVTKKPTKTYQKHGDSKPEETGFNGYHYDVGSNGFNSPTKLGGGGGGGGGGGQGGMMGASYMRSSSPFYNFHVMLD